MFVYGPNNIRDIPTRLILYLKGEENVRTFELADGLSALVAPGGEVVIAQADPELTNKPGRVGSIPMRIMWTFPWDNISFMQFEYDTPFPTMDEGQELKEIEEALARMPADEDEEVLGDPNDQGDPNKPEPIN